MLANKPLMHSGDCMIENCHAPMERSRLFKAGKFEDYMAKGSKKTEKLEKNLSMSQICFVQMLLDLTEDNVRELISLREMLQDSLRSKLRACTICLVPHNVPRCTES